MENDSIRFNDKDYKAAQKLVMFVPIPLHMTNDDLLAVQIAAVLTMEGDAKVV